MRPITFWKVGVSSPQIRQMFESFNIMGRISKGLSGVSGEYFVAAELSRRGYIASITLRNTRGVDILVAGDDAAQSAGIQVKTNQDARPSWILTKKAETLSEPNLYYVFVRLNGLEGNPLYHVVPSNVVARMVKTSHAKWLSEPGRGGHKRRPTDMRKFDDFENEWLSRWDLLGF